MISALLKRSVLSAVLAALICGGAAQAQDEEESGVLDESDFVIIKKIEQKQDDGYVPANFQNLSKLYWAMGKMDIAKDANIDNFLLINECPLFKQYYNNDIEWAELRRATREKIMRDMPTYPRKFEVMLPIYLGEYDTQTQSFAIRPESDYTNVQRLEVAPNAQYQRICDRAGDVPEYPRNIIVTLSRPFSLQKVPVPEELAKLYIEETRIKFETLPAKFRSEKYRRIAYLRLRITASQYKETIIVEARFLRAVFFARWDGFEIYADPYKEKLLYKEEAKTMRARQRKNFEALKRAADEQDRKIREAAENRESGPEGVPQEPVPLDNRLAPPGQ